MLILVFKIFANDFMTINNTALHPHADHPLEKKMPSVPLNCILIVFIYDSKEVLL